MAVSWAEADALLDESLQQGQPSVLEQLSQWVSLSRRSPEPQHDATFPSWQRSFEEPLASDLNGQQCVATSAPWGVVPHPCVYAQRARAAVEAAGARCRQPLAMASGEGNRGGWRTTSRQSHPWRALSGQVLTAAAAVQATRSGAPASGKASSIAATRPCTTGCPGVRAHGRSMPQQRHKRQRSSWYWRASV